MTYFVKDECIKCKLMDCVEVCPVDCFYEGENMLVIHPEECIDCGVCEPECPVEAIVADTGYEKDDKKKWLDINNKYSKLWPNITKKKNLQKMPINSGMKKINMINTFQINQGNKNGKKKKENKNKNFK